MPIDRDKRLVFIHIPKTGGTTVERILGLYEAWPAVRMDILRGPYELDGQQLHMQHLSLAELAAIGALDFSAWFKFAFVRNPWDRVVSSYFFKRRNKSVTDPDDFGKYLDHVESVVEQREALSGDNCHLRPQTDYELKELDFVGRFENFEVELAELFDQLQIPVASIPHEHKSTRTHYSSYFDDKTRRQVERIYAADIDELGYRFERRS